MKSTPRTRKLGEAVREALAEVLREDVSDPRLDFATITSVQVASDLGVADVYVTTHGDQERYDELLEGRRSADGRIRSGRSAAASRASLRRPVEKPTTSWPSARATSRASLMDTRQASWLKGRTMPVTPRIEMPPTMPRRGLRVFLAISSPPATVTTARNPCVSCPRKEDRAFCWQDPAASG